MASDVERAIVVLEECIRATGSELDVVERLDRGLEALRASYRRSQESFGPADLKRLGFVAHIRELAAELMQLRQEIACARDLRDARGIETALVELEEGLRETMIVKRARKELSDLDAIRGCQRASKEDLQQARAAAQLREMQARADACPQRHRMVLRESKRGLFWGCSRYPACRATRDLSEKERALSK